MKKIALLILIVWPVAAHATDSYELLTAVLRGYVRAGKVQYAPLCKDGRLKDSIAQLAGTNPDTLPDQNAKLAFWINAYNAYTIQAICGRYPIKSINDLHGGGLVLGSIMNTTVWDRDFVVINNKKMTLNHIEHKIVRPLFHDPRAHFALVCASKSCPALRFEAFEGNRLDEQLNDQGMLFFADPYRNRFDVPEKKATLSKILDWYSKDFGPDRKTVLLFVARFLPDDLAASIRSEPEAWKISYLDYDWSLNE